MERDGNVIKELTTDHHEVAELFTRIETLPTGDQRRRKLMDQLTMELVRHSVAEEVFLYPAVRAHVRGGGELADEHIEDHIEVEGMLKDLGGRTAADPQFASLVSRLKTEVTIHVADEETKLFPLLAAACSAEDLQALGEQVRTAKKTAPTWPHLSAPGASPANKLLASGAGLIDRIRDALSGRGKD